MEITESSPTDRAPTVVARPLNLDVRRMTPQPKFVSYEPVFGGIAATLAAGLLCLLLFPASTPNTSRTGIGYLVAISFGVISWGVGQIVGYRIAKRRNIPLQPPTLGTALGCVLIGLLMSMVTVFLYMFSPTHRSCVILSGAASIVLLSVGVMVGIRQGVWRNA